MPYRNKEVDQLFDAWRKEPTGQLSLLSGYFGSGKGLTIKQIRVCAREHGIPLIELNWNDFGAYAHGAQVFMGATVQDYGEFHEQCVLPLKEIVEHATLNTQVGAEHIMRCISEAAKRSLEVNVGPVRYPECESTVEALRGLMSRRYSLKNVELFNNPENEMLEHIANYAKQHPGLILILRNVGGQSSLTLRTGFEFGSLAPADVVMATRWMQLVVQRLLEADTHVFAVSSPDAHNKFGIRKNVNTIRLSRATSEECCLIFREAKRITPDTELVGEILKRTAGRIGFIRGIAEYLRADPSVTCLRDLRKWWDENCALFPPVTDRDLPGYIQTLRERYFLEPAVKGDPRLLNLAVAPVITPDLVPQLMCGKHGNAPGSFERVRDLGIIGEQCGEDLFLVEENCREFLGERACRNLGVPSFEDYLRSDTAKPFHRLAHDHFTKHPAANSNEHVIDAIKLHRRYLAGG